MRRLDVTFGENFRDLGGYTTEDGDRTRWRKFLRGGDMDKLSEADQALLLDYGIDTVIDLRMEWEIDAQPNVFAESPGVDFIVHDFWGKRFDDYRSKDKKAPPEKKLADLYCEGLVRSNFVMADIIRTLAEPARGGAVFHCRSGKDRTGLVSAVLLAIAGVPSATICADYAFTATCLQSEAINPVDLQQPGGWQKTCSPETMSLTLDFLDREYGGVTSYLKDAGVSDTDIESIREKFVEPRG